MGSCESGWGPLGMCMICCSICFEEQKDYEGLIPLSSRSADGSWASAVGPLGIASNEENCPSQVAISNGRWMRALKAQSSHPSEGQLSEPGQLLKLLRDPLCMEAHLPLPSPTSFPAEKHCLLTVLFP